ncbi:MAG: bifunctional DNA-formamidopyrimidine glycosylase/DNA-(apurinic or apyrimidinic site) lyase [Candidatus Omnitrophota bacterium]
MSLRRAFFCAKMPELPEVENVKKSLKNSIINNKITQVDVLTPKIVRSNPSIFKKNLTNVSVVEIARKGKNLIMALSNSYYLIVHLGMSGHILLQKHIPVNDKHAHLIIKFLNPPLFLIYRDIRKFGYLKVLSGKEVVSFLDKIGIDALKVTPEEFKKIIHGHKRKIKPLLLDQRLISGIGNIYCDEALFDAKIHPERNSFSLSEKEIKKLYGSIAKILKEAVKKGGSSVSDYVMPNARKGDFQSYHKVYRRKGKKCPRCGTHIKRIEVAQRGTYICPSCQS